MRGEYPYREFRRMLPRCRGRLQEIELGQFFHSPLARLYIRAGGPARANRRGRCGDASRTIPKPGDRSRPPCPTCTLRLPNAERGHAISRSGRGTRAAIGPNRKTGTKHVEKFCVWHENTVYYTQRVEKMKPPPTGAAGPPPTGAAGPATPWAGGAGERASGAEARAVGAGNQVGRGRQAGFRSRQPGSASDQQPRRQVHRSLAARAPRRTAHFRPFSGRHHARRDQGTRPEIVRGRQDRRLTLPRPRRDSPVRAACDAIVFRFSQRAIQAVPVPGILKSAVLTGTLPRARISQLSDDWKGCHERDECVWPGSCLRHAGRFFISGLAEFRAVVDPAHFSMAIQSVAGGRHAPVDLGRRRRRLERRGARRRIFLGVGERERASASLPVIGAGSSGSRPHAARRTAGSAGVRDRPDDSPHAVDGKRHPGSFSFR